MTRIPWTERLNAISINPIMATENDIAKMAADLAAFLAAPGQYVTTTRAAGIIGSVSSSTLLRLARSGKVKSFKTPGGHYRVSVEAVRAFFSGALK